MIDPSDIVLHLRTYLPAFTDLFSDTVTGTAVAFGNTVTVTSTAHGLIVGTKFVVAGGTFRNVISAATDNGDGTVRFTTTSDHDLTEAKSALDPTTIALAGFSDAPWNNTFTLVSVPNRRTFEVAFPTGETNLPTLGSGYLVEDRKAGALGLQEVATVPNANTFTFTVSGVPSFPSGTIDGFSLVTGVRVAGVASLERAQKLYAKSGANARPWLFVMMLDADVSKDRHALNDSIGVYTTGNLGKQIVLQNFATIAYIPTNEKESGFDAQNTCYGDLFRALSSVLYGFQFPDPDTAQSYVTVCAGHGVGTYYPPYYSHVYDWQVPSVMVFENSGYNLTPDVAFRDIASTWNVNGDAMAQLDLNINLDDEPLA